MKKLFYTFLMILAINTIAFSQYWMQQASMFNYGRHSGIGCSLNGKGYVGLGKIYNNTLVNDFWEYDTTSNVWIQKANYPGAGLHQSTCFVINDKIYVGLGANTSAGNQTDLWEYNPVTDTWVQKASFPGTARYGAKAFVIGDSAFVVAGSYNSISTYLYDMYMYSPATNTWKVKADFAGGGRNEGTAFSINGIGYYCCGTANNSVLTQECWKYNPTTNAWSAIPDFPATGTLGPISFVVDNKAYVGFGGNYASTIYYNNIGIYDPLGNSWQTLSVPPDVLERRWGMSFSIGDIGYVTGGQNATGVATDLWAFSLTSFTTNLSKAESDNDLKIFPNPASSQLSIESVSFKNAEEMSISIYNVQGQLMLNKSIKQATTIIDISSYAKGIYFVHVKTDKEIATKKFIKE